RSRRRERRPAGGTSGRTPQPHAVSVGSRPAGRPGSAAALRSDQERAGQRDEGRKRYAHGRSRQPRTVCAMKVLVREEIAEAGVDLLRAKFDVDVDSDSDLASIIDRYDAIVI